MNYTIFRDEQQYGPYTLADLQRYVSSGEVLLTDMAISDGMGEPVPVSQIVGNIPVPAVVMATSIPAVEYPNPPNMHWLWVLLFTFLTRGLFEPVWGIVLSSWLKKVEPTSKALNLYIAEISGMVLIVVIGMSGSFGPVLGILLLLLVLASVVCSLLARFSFRASMERHYNDAEGIPLTLSSVMTFFFSAIYFQDRVNHVRRLKKARQLEVASLSLPASN